MIKVAAISFVTCFFAILVVLAGSALAVSVLADAQGWNSFSLGQGPFKVLEFERNARGTETLFGAGIVTLAAAAGALNAGVALWLRGTLLSKQH